MKNELQFHTIHCIQYTVLSCLNIKEYSALQIQGTKLLYFSSFSLVKIESVELHFFFCNKTNIYIDCKFSRNFILCAPSTVKQCLVLLQAVGNCSAGVYLLFEWIQTAISKTAKLCLIMDKLLRCLSRYLNHVLFQLLSMGGKAWGEWQLCQ